MARTLTVTTPHGTFTRRTDNDYAVVRVGMWRDGVTVGTTWHRSLRTALQADPTAFWRVLGFYSVADGSQVAGPRGGREALQAGKVAKAAPKPVVVHEFEVCEACDRRHDPARLRCGNCWRCHEPSVACKVTKSEVAASIDRHNSDPIMWRVLTREWRPFSELRVPQCECHRP